LARVADKRDKLLLKRDNKNILAHDIGRVDPAHAALPNPSARGQSMLKNRPEWPIENTRPS